MAPARGNVYSLSAVIWEMLIYKKDFLRRIESCLKFHTQVKAIYDKRLTLIKGHRGNDRTQMESPIGQADVPTI